MCVPGLTLVRISTSLALNGTVRMLERVFGSSKWPFVRRASYTKESTL